jgi:hypothetical protein
MLEYGIKTAWYSLGGLKLMSSMPSRVHSLRFPTIGLVALKLWCFDQALKYDRAILPGEKSVIIGRGRPKGGGVPRNKEGGGSSSATGSRKNKKTFN